MSLPAETAAYVAAAPDGVREGLLAMRALVLRVAGDEGICVVEALRWGQPAFLAPKGTSLRIGVAKGAGFALLVHCQTGLIEAFRAGPGAGLRFDGVRAVLFDRMDEIDEAALAILIRDALRYHERRRGRRG